MPPVRPDPGTKPRLKPSGLFRITDPATRPAASTTTAVSSLDLLRTSAEQMGLQVVRIDPNEIPKSTVSVLPAELARYHSVVPFNYDEGTATLTVAISDPFNIGIIDDLRTALQGITINLVVASEEQITSAITILYSSGVTEALAVQPISAESTPTPTTTTATTAIDINVEKVDPQAPIPSLVRLFMRHLIESGASDGCIDPEDGIIRLSTRIDGMIQQIEPTLGKYQEALVACLKGMANLNITEKSLPQDGRIRVTLNDRVYDLRINISPGYYGESVTIRILDSHRAKIELDQLNLTQAHLQKTRDALTMPNGIVLITGPTGSGKTTTLYAMLNHLNNGHRRILTVEDPVEYVLPGVTHAGINPARGYTFPLALRGMLRQTPDVILVGEIRDDETAKIATQAAMTGHLVLSGLHTNDAATAVTRLSDLGVEIPVMTASLRMVFAQRLARRLCSCKIADNPDETLLRLFASDEALGAAQSKAATIYTPGKCGHCLQVGYRGRIGLHEVLIMSEKLNKAITNGADAQTIRTIASEHGMLSLRQDGWGKVLTGETSLEEVLRVTMA